MSARDGATPAEAALLRLLRRAERAMAAAGADAGASPTSATSSADGVSLPMTAASCPEYGALASLADLEAFHAAIAVAERAGAIRAERDALRGDGQRLRRLHVRDASALAAHLGLGLRAEGVQRAAATLAPWRAAHPVLDALLDAWTAGRLVRGRGPEAHHELADALRVVDACAAGAADVERLLRRESVRLFGDSKRIEALTPWLDLLQAGELPPSGLAREDVWAGLGLRRQPQPMMLAGRIGLRLGDQALALPPPWLGVAPEALRGIDGAPGFVLSIENLASFHEAAALASARPCLVAYTGGMPSPAWRRAWARVLADVPVGTPVLHWSDIDEGGFRIAHALQDLAHATGHALRPWCMDPAALDAAERAQASPAPPAALRGMQRWAARCGWDALADTLGREACTLEQEAVQARLPD